jgi:hypothetical protein
VSSFGVEKNFKRRIILNYSLKIEKQIREKIFCSSSSENCLFI